MSKTQPKKHFQIQRMFGLAKAPADMYGGDIHDHLSAIAHVETNGRTGSLKELTFDEANKVIVALGGEPFRAYGNSKRNENYKKQAAGIKTIETDAHLRKIDDLAAKLGWDADRLRGFCQRQIKRDVPTTTEEGNKVLEGLKAMVKRQANVVTFPTRNPEPETLNQIPAQPSFRRVA